MIQFVTRLPRKNDYRTTTTETPIWPDGLMDEHLQLVGVVGLVACLILGIVVIALCVVLFCQKCRHRDALRRPFERRRSESILDDDPPDYDWCAENAGYRPDPETDSIAPDPAMDMIPPAYEAAIQPGTIIIDANRLMTGTEAYKNLSGAGLVQGVGTHNRDPPLS